MISSDSFALSSIATDYDFDTYRRFTQSRSKAFSKLNDDPIFAEFAIEAKLYNPGIFNKKRNTVGVKEVSRLISRIRNRQFGILVTTSAVAEQAYNEVRIDGHPIIFLSGGDIVKVLIEKGINSAPILKAYLKENFIRNT